MSFKSFLEHKAPRILNFCLNCLAVESGLFGVLQSRPHSVCVYGWTAVWQYNRWIYCWPVRSTAHIVHQCLAYHHLQPYCNGCVQLQQLPLLAISCWRLHRSLWSCQLHPSHWTCWAEAEGIRQCYDDSEFCSWGWVVVTSGILHSRLETAESCYSFTRSYRCLLLQASIWFKLINYNLLAKVTVCI